MRILSFSSWLFVPRANLQILKGELVTHPPRQRSQLEKTSLLIRVEEKLQFPCNAEEILCEFAKNQSLVNLTPLIMIRIKQIWSIGEIMASKIFGWLWKENRGPLRTVVWNSLPRKENFKIGDLNL